MSTHIIMTLKEDEVESEITGGMLTLTLRDGNERVYININGGDIVNIARKLGNPTVTAKRETANA